MKVKEIMSRKIVTVNPELPFRDLWKIIFKRHINAVPVLNKQGQLLGLITRENMMENLYPDYHEFIEILMTVTDFEDMEEKIHDLLPLKAKDFMSKVVIFTREETPVMRALSRMIVRRVNQLPVLSKDNLIVGMITKGDIFYALFKHHLSKQPGERQKKS